jgi:peptidoglycan/LPS O-acetylase OafA/YrhL
VAGLTALVLVMVNQGSPSPWEGCVILALMFTGTLIYRTQQRQPGTSRQVTAAIVVGVLALTTFAGLWHGHQRHMSHQWLIQWATSVLLAGATFGLGLAASHRRVPRWCAWLGMISFSVYLLHPIVFDAYRDVPVLHRPHTFGVQVLMFAGCVAVIIGLSTVTYYLVERPMQRLGRRLSGRGGGSGGGGGSGEPAGVTAGRSVEQAGQSVEQAGQSVEQKGQSVDYATGVATGAAIGSGSAATDAGSGRDTDSDRPGAPTAARSASSSSAVAGGSGASP